MSRDYVQKWTNSHAIRELIANAIDGSIFGKIEVNFEEDWNNKPYGTLRIKNEGEPIKPRNFLLGVGDFGENTIGQFHEGLKLAMLVLARNHIDVTLKIGEDSNEFLISGIAKEIVEEAKNLFLKFQKYRKVFEDKDGRQILEMDTDNGKNGQFFVQGLKQNVKENMMLSYNIPKRQFPLSRDRHLADAYAVQQQTTKVILHLEDEEILNQILGVLLDINAKYFDIDVEKMYIYSSFQGSSGWKNFVQKTFKNSALCQNDNQAYVAGSLGKRGIIVQDSNVTQFLHYFGAKTFEEIVPDFYDLDLEKIGTNDQKLNKFLAVINRVTPNLNPYDYKYYLFTLKTNSGKDRRNAFVKNGKIYIKKSAWESEEDWLLLGSIAHELIHIFGPDLNEVFEMALTKYLGESLDYIKKFEKPRIEPLEKPRAGLPDLFR